jgi:hypothetical protein
VGPVHVEYCIRIPVEGGSKKLDGSGYWLLDVSISAWERQTDEGVNVT